MIKWIFKYSFVLFLFNTVLLSIESTKDIGNNVFLFVMVLYTICLLINPNYFKHIISHKAFLFLLILILLNVVYFFIFHSINDIKALNYLLARTVQFSIISISIYSNYYYYKTKFLSHLIYFISFIVFVGFLFNSNLLSGRYAGIIWNPNMLASFTSIVFAVLFLKEKDKTRADIFLTVVFLIVFLATGSRGVLIAIALAVLFKYGFSRRSMIYTFLCLLVSLILINIQLDTSINRFASQTLFNDRIVQYQLALETIYNNIYSGYGLDKYSFVDKKLAPYSNLVTVLGAHNGYLAILTQYGIVFGSIVLFVILSKSIQVIRYFSNSSNVERTYLFILVYALFASVYETLLTGINEFHTILFWFSLVFLSYSKFKKLNEI